MADKELSTLIDEDDALLWCVHNWHLEHQEFFNELVEKIPWEQKIGSLYGKEYKIPRLMYHMGDADIDKYTRYGGQSSELHAWHPKLKIMRDHLQKNMDIRLDSCLLNYYVSGEHSISDHSDKESLGENKATVGISLGESRRFVWKKIGVKRVKGMTKKIVNDITYIYNPDGEIQSLSFETKSGDLYCMSGKIHKLWTHGIPKTKEEKGGRISLTFRQIMPDSWHCKNDQK